MVNVSVICSSHGLLNGSFPKTHQYRVTDFGFRAALFFTWTHARLYRPGFAEVLPNSQTHRQAAPPCRSVSQNPGGD
jgi:hypothetical protein